MIAPRAFVFDEEAHRATANAVKLAGSKLFLLIFVVVSFAIKAAFRCILFFCHTILSFFLPFVNTFWEKEGIGEIYSICLLKIIIFLVICCIFNKSMI